MSARDQDLPGCPWKALYPRHANDTFVAKQTPARMRAAGQRAAARTRIDNRHRKDNPMKVGFIGPGIMGAPMALNLLGAGHTPFACTRGRVGADYLDAPVSGGDEAVFERVRPLFELEVAQA
jgi:hypothetical protein